MVMTTEESPQPITPGMVRRDNFGSTELQASGGMQDSAMAAAMEAAIQARYVMALRRPRNMQTVRVTILNECKRYDFAASAMYALPRGGQTVTGLSIRFAEMVLRRMTNTHTEIVMLYDDPSKRMVRVNLIDLETNTTFTQDIVVEKTVERSSNRGRGECIGSRVNSAGKPVYLFRSDESETQQKTASQVSRALRKHALRLLDGDICEEAEATIHATLDNPSHDVWDKTIKALVDAYATKLRIMPDELEKYLKHPVSQINPEKLKELRLLFTALQSGEIGWSEVLAEIGGKEEEASTPPSKSQKLHSILAKRAVKDATPEPDETSDTKTETPEAERETPKPPSETVTKSKDADAAEDVNFKARAAKMVAKGKVEVD